MRMPFDAAVRGLLDEQHRDADVVPPRDTAGRVQFVRALIDRLVHSRSSIPGLPNSVTTEDRAIGTIKVRLYHPIVSKDAPTLVYLHGGGWVAGSIDSHDPFCRLLAERAGLHIVSVDYRRAPEHPFPAALDDVAAALEWTADNAHRWNSDRRVAIGGDSAGANLAAVTANRVASTNAITALVLLYPVTDHPSANHASYDTNGSGYGLDANLIRWFWDMYAGDEDPNNQDVSPLRIPTIPALPPTLIATAEYDVLRDEGIAYAKRLAENGVDVHHLHAPDMPHNFPVFPDMVARFPQSTDAMNAIASWLKTTLCKQSQAQP